MDRLRGGREEGVGGGGRVVVGFDLVGLTLELRFDVAGVGFDGVRSGFERVERGFDGVVEVAAFGDCVSGAGAGAGTLAAGRGSAMRERDVSRSEPSRTTAIAAIADEQKRTAAAQRSRLERRGLATVATLGWASAAGRPSVTAGGAAARCRRTRTGASTAGSSRRTRASEMRRARSRVASTGSTSTSSGLTPRSGIRCESWRARPA